MKVINTPGPNHEKLLATGDRVGKLVFSGGKRLHKDEDLCGRSHSAGDGARIIRKCTSILGGTAGIRFERERTTFAFRAPVKLHLPPA